MPGADNAAGDRCSGTDAAGQRQPADQSTVATTRAVVETSELLWATRRAAAFARDGDGAARLTLAPASDGGGAGLCGLRDLARRSGTDPCRARVAGAEPVPTGQSGYPSRAIE